MKKSNCRSQQEKHRYGCAGRLNDFYTAMAYWGRLNWSHQPVNLVLYPRITANVLVSTTNQLFQIEKQRIHVRSFFVCCLNSDTTCCKIGRSPEDVLRSLTSCVLHIQPSLPRTAPKMFRSLLEAMAAVEPLHNICECILKLRY